MLSIRIVSVIAGTLVLNCGARETSAFRHRGNPICLVVVPDEIRSHERLCWRGPAVIYRGGPENRRVVLSRTCFNNPSSELFRYWWDTEIKDHVFVQNKAFLWLLHWTGHFIELSRNDASVFSVCVACAFNKIHLCPNTKSRLWM